MTLLEAIRKAKELRPTACSEEMLASMVNDLDCKIAEVMGVTPPTNTFPADRELLMTSPYESVYVEHLAAMIDYYNQETELYQNDAIIANNTFSEAIAWWRRNHKPTENNYWRVW